MNININILLLPVINDHKGLPIIIYSSSSWLAYVNCYTAGALFLKRQLIFSIVSSWTFLTTVQHFVINTGAYLLINGMEMRQLKLIRRLVSRDRATYGKLASWNVLRLGPGLSQIPSCSQWVMKTVASRVLYLWEVSHLLCWGKFVRA